MLIGSYYHSLQTKGRLAIPASFRKGIGLKPILTTGIEPCLNILPFNIWSNLTKNLGISPLHSSESRALRRLLAHSATNVDFDSQGRILIPKTLINWAQLYKRVVIAGSIDWIEIWDIDRYKAYMKKTLPQSAHLAEAIHLKNYES